MINEMYIEKRKTKFGVLRVEETKNDDLAYSIIYLNSTGKTIVSIGMNPRGRLNDKVENNLYKDYEEVNLEPTRRNTIYQFSNEFGYEFLRELIQLDLFSKRTENSKELRNLLKVASCDDLKKLIGISNYKTIKDTIEKADYILLAWGCGVPWESLSDYKNLLYQLLSKQSDKLYWFGQTSDDSPRHPTSRREKNKLMKMNQDDIKKVLRITTDER